jgi:site-specific DNA recombinase
LTNFGIALCRVSTSKQRLEGSSLNAQEVRINKVATELFDCEILKTWSLDISSRKGKNFKRKDLEEMLAYCKKDKRIKYLFVDEHDRYMRSVDEYYMWKGRFLYESGVTLVIAAKPELALNPNSASMAIEFFGIWQGETSNEERINKTTDKMQAKVALGYWPGSAHTCYQKTAVKGLHEPLQPYWGLLQTATKRILYDGYTLHQALNWLHDNGFEMSGKSKLHMHRFKRLLQDPYYAGINKMSSWDIEGVGLHKAMITREEHEQLKAVALNLKPKFIRNIHNPNFPMSNLVDCSDCAELNRKYNKVVGYKNHNGKNPENRKYYERYMCRACKLGITKADLHEQVATKLAPLKTSKATKDELKAAMRIVWERRAADDSQMTSRLEKKRRVLMDEKDNLIRAIGVSPSLAADIEQSVAKIKAEILEIEQEMATANNPDDEFNDFVEFSLNYVDDLNATWWDLTPDRRERCKQLSFPGGIFIDKNKSVSTPLLSAIYRYEATKKEPVTALGMENLWIGGPGEIRTHDTWIKSPLL